VADRPVGHADGKYFLLSSAGELRSIAGKDLEAGKMVFDLFVGGEVGGTPVEDWLEVYFPQRARRADPAHSGFDARAAGRWLMRCCRIEGLMNPRAEVRSLGLWRGKGGAAMVHAGEHVVWAGGARAAGFRGSGREIYPASAGDEFEGAEMSAMPAADCADYRIRLAALRDDIQAGWAWSREDDCAAWWGWLGQAALGAYPGWRAHLWTYGKRGSGKSTLAETAAALLGPMSHGLWNDITEAAVRQSADRQSRAFLFDEREPSPEGIGKLQALVELFRNLSGGGARVQRGSSDHGGRSFVLNGAGSLSSILPPPLDPQDASRFVVLGLDPRRRREAADLARLARIVRERGVLGAELWRYVLAQAHRWDPTVAAYRGLVEGMGGEPRDAETIGAVLAGYDLLFEAAPEPSAERLELRAPAARALLEAAQAAAEMGEGEQCLSRLLDTTVHFGAGKSHHLARLVYHGIHGDEMQRGEARRCLSRLGLRVRSGDAGGELLITPRKHAGLDASVYARTRWAAGGHAAALKLLDGVRVGPPTKVGGANVRPIVVPERHLPDFAGEPD
ncbi:MAG: hypothetical protein AAFR16_00280, partial [Pseudomonadota bacterium]